MDKLPRITLGATGLEVSAFGIGGFHQLEVTADAVAAVIDEYARWGGNYVETAVGYGAGDSEDKIGRALEGRRDQFVLASKSGAATADAIRADLEQSLKRLRTDRLDFYFFHGADVDKIDAITAPGGAVEGLRRAIDEGILGGMGLSSHMPRTYLKAMERIDLSVILIWCNYLDNLNFPLIPDTIIPEARRRGVGVTAMKPLADGLLWKSVDPAVRYCLSAGAEVVVCGSNSPRQVREVAAAVCRGAAADERQAILRDAPELGRYVCRRCGACGEPLMRLFELEGRVDRQMMDFLSHDPAEYALRRALAGWFGRADEARQWFAAEQFNRDQLEAQARAVTCPYGIDLPRKLALAWEKLRPDGRPGRV